MANAKSLAASELPDDHLQTDIRRVELSSLDALESIDCTAFQSLYINGQDENKEHTFDSQLEIKRNYLQRGSR
jgi:hypothetical protein